MGSSVRTAAFLVLLPAILGLLAPACTADYILYSGETLYGGQSLAYEGYTFTMQQDCNLVLYDNGGAVWSSGTNNKGYNCILRMQTDGNLVVYSNNGANAIWASNTSRQQGNYVLIMQKDRNVVIYGPAIWATNTHVGTSSGVVISQNVTTSSGPVVAVAADAEDLNNSNRKIAMVTKN